MAYREYIMMLDLGEPWYHYNIQYTSISSQVTPGNHEIQREHLYNVGCPGEP